MFLWLWWIAGLAALGMTGLAVWRPRLKAAWWVALGTGLVMALLWAVAFPAAPRTVLWPGRWAPVLPPPAQHITPWQWAAGLALLTTAWAGMALTGTRPAPPVARPGPWRWWLLAAMLGLTALTAATGWALAVAWMLLDLLVLAVEMRIYAGAEARAAALQRTAARALFWVLPLWSAALPAAWQSPLWAAAVLARAWATRMPPLTEPASIFASTGRWVFWLPWLATLAPWLAATRAQPAFPVGLALAVAVVGLGSAWRAWQGPTPAARQRGWAVASAVLVLLAAMRDPQAAQAWLLALFLLGLNREALTLLPDPWLIGLVAVLWGGPALMLPFTPTAITAGLWRWPPAGLDAAQAAIYGLLLAAAWRHWPRPREGLAAFPRGAQILAAWGLLLPGVTLWGIGLRLGWLTPPPGVPGWAPWLLGPALTALAALASRWPRGTGAARRVALPRPEDFFRLALRAGMRRLEDVVLFATALLEGEGGLFWALVALAVGFLLWKGG